MIKQNQKLKLRAKEVSELYSIGLSTVWLYAKEGKLNPIKISSKVTIFDAKEVETFFSGNVA